MDQATVDELGRLHRACNEAYKMWVQEGASLLPRPITDISYTDEVRASLKVSLDKRDVTLKPLGERIKEIVDKCDHREPDGSSNIRWSPCDTDRCGYCGAAWDECGDVEIR